MIPHPCMTFFFMQSLLTNNLSRNFTTMLCLSMFKHNYVLLFSSLFGDFNYLVVVFYPVSLISPRTPVWMFDYGLIFWFFPSIFCLLFFLDLFIFTFQSSCWVFCIWFYYKSRLSWRGVLWTFLLLLFKKEHLRDWWHGWMG